MGLLFLLVLPTGTKITLVATAVKAFARFFVEGAPGLFHVKRACQPQRSRQRFPLPGRRRPPSPRLSDTFSVSNAFRLASILPRLRRSRLPASYFSLALISCPFRAAVRSTCAQCPTLQRQCQQFGRVFLWGRLPPAFPTFSVTRPFPWRTRPRRQSSSPLPRHGWQAPPACPRRHRPATKQGTRDSRSPCRSPAACQRP